MPAGLFYILIIVLWALGLIGNIFKSNPLNIILLWALPAGAGAGFAINNLL